MSPNGRAVRAALPLGHFLFTSESVGEGHPGVYKDTFTGLYLICH